MDPQQQKKQPAAPQQRLPDWMLNWRRMRDKMYNNSADRAADNAADDAKAAQDKKRTAEDIKTEAATRILLKEIALQEGRARADMLDTIRDLFAQKAADEGRGAAEPAPPVVGDALPDGSVYVGVSPETKAPLFAAPADESESMSFNRAARRAEERNKNAYLGHEDWRLPTKGELRLLFRNADKGAFSGTFDRDGQSWYWAKKNKAAQRASKNTASRRAVVQNFRTGTQKCTPRSKQHKVRLVR